LRFRRADIFRYVDALCLEHGKAATGDFRVGIGNSTHHTGDTCLNQGAGAGAGAALMGAGLKAHISRRPFREATGAAQSFHFSMGTSTRLRPATPYDTRPTRLILADNDAADRRIGRDTAKPPRGKRKGMSHELRVMWPHGHGRIPISRCQARSGPQHAA
jgi:hypothetical protein